MTYEDCEIIREFPLRQEIYRQRIIKDGGIKESKCWYQIKIIKTVIKKAK